MEALLDSAVTLHIHTYEKSPSFNVESFSVFCFAQKVGAVFLSPGPVGPTAHMFNIYWNVHTHVISHARVL